MNFNVNNAQFYERPVNDGPSPLRNGLYSKSYVPKPAAIKPAAIKPAAAENISPHLAELHEEARRNDARDGIYVCKTVNANANSIVPQMTRLNVNNSSVCGNPYDPYFDNFIGFWLQNTCMGFTMPCIEFYIDSITGVFMVRVFMGTQPNLRQATAADNVLVNGGNPGSTEFPIEMVGEFSMILLTIEDGFGGPDELGTTARIQDSDNDVLYMNIVDKAYFGPLCVSLISQYRRLPEKPPIQLTSLPSLTEWSDPVNMFSYMKEFLLWQANPQKAVSLNTSSYIGFAAYNQLYQDLLTTGVTTTSQSTLAYRGGTYIGIWTTKFAIRPTTTIYTDGPHGFNLASTINISGLTGDYAVLNGVKIVYPRLPTTGTDMSAYPYRDQSSYEFNVLIAYNSSLLPVYNPTLHGRATLTSTYGPVTPDISYREFVAAMNYFMSTAFGPSTHDRLQFWYNGQVIPETFQQLKVDLAAGRLFLQTRRQRPWTANSSGGMYWNALLTNGSLNYPTFNINDPFGNGIWDAAGPDYDIDIENYLDKTKTYNMYFTLTGPIGLPGSITASMVANGYTSNGSVVKWIVSPFGTFPPPLIDSFGTHPYMRYQAAGNDPIDSSVVPFGFVGGMINSAYTGGKSIAYLRILNEGPVDANLIGYGGASPSMGLITYYPTEFDIGIPPSTNVQQNVWTAAWAQLTKQLNLFSPDRYIIDIRANQGGSTSFANAMSSLFGATRSNEKKSSVVYSSPSGNSGPLVMEGSDIQTVRDVIPTIPDQMIEVSAIEAAFPGSTVTGTVNKPMTVIILTSTVSASGGDAFPHSFTGADPNTNIHDLGANVTCKIYGDISGVNDTTFLSYQALPINSLDNPLTDGNTGLPVTAVYFSVEAGSVSYDAGGYIVNQNLNIKPALLLPAWYELQWQDIGTIPVTNPYPLGALKPPPVWNPNYSTASTWRDLWLENAIVN